MAWWIWIVLGAVLLAAELFLIEAEFYLVFLGIAAITVGFQWEVFCREFGAAALAADERLRTNGQRVAARDWLLPKLEEILRRHTKAQLAAKLEAIGLPYAPITRPRDLFEDPHLNAGGMVERRTRAACASRCPGCRSNWTASGPACVASRLRSRRTHASCSRRSAMRPRASTR